MFITIRIFTSSSWVLWKTSVIPAPRQKDQELKANLGFVGLRPAGLEETLFQNKAKGLRCNAVLHNASTQDAEAVELSHLRLIEA